MAWPFSRDWSPRFEGDDVDPDAADAQIDDLADDTEDGQIDDLGPDSTDVEDDDTTRDATENLGSDSSDLSDDTESDTQADAEGDGDSDGGANVDSSADLGGSTNDPDDGCGCSTKHGRNLPATQITIMLLFGLIWWRRFRGQRPVQLTLVLGAS